MMKAILVLMALASQAGAQSRDWSAVQRLERQEDITVSLRDGRVVCGKSEKWTPAALTL